MSGSDVTKDGLVGVRPGRDATIGVNDGRDTSSVRSRGRRRAAETPMVPDAQFSSYYGKPVINSPVWAAPDIPGYIYLGGLAGAASVLGAGAQLTGRPALERAMKVGAFGSVSLGMVGLVHDLGRPARFLNMLRVFKPTSPMSVGSWVLSAYGPAAGVAAGTAVTGLFPRLGAAATAGAAALGPVVASYTAALLADTAVPAWHDGFRQLPFLFVGSGASAAGGLGLIAAPLSENAPARRAAVLGAALELAATKHLERSLPDVVAKPYHAGTSGALMRAAEVLTGASALAALALGGRSRRAAMAAGAGLLTASALTRWGIFQAGYASANDPQATVEPQRRRARERRSE